MLNYSDITKVKPVMFENPAFIGPHGSTDLGIKLILLNSIFKSVLFIIINDQKSFSGSRITNHDIEKIVKNEILPWADCKNTKSMTTESLIHLGIFDRCLQKTHIQDIPETTTAVSLHAQREYGPKNAYAVYLYKDHSFSELTRWEPGNGYQDWKKTYRLFFSAVLNHSFSTTASYPGTQKEFVSRVEASMNYRKLWGGKNGYSQLSKIMSGYNLTMEANLYKDKSFHKKFSIIQPEFIEFLVKYVPIFCTSPDRQADKLCYKLFLSNIAKYENAREVTAAIEKEWKDAPSH